MKRPSQTMLDKSLIMIKKLLISCLKLFQISNYEFIAKIITFIKITFIIQPDQSKKSFYVDQF
jgi:hypothetical protein